MNQELLQMIKFGRLLAMTMLIAHSLLGPLNQLRAEEPGKQKSSTHDLIRHLLDQDLGTRTFPFPDVVRASCGKNVIPVDLENPAHQLILDAIAAAADHAITALSSSSSPNSPSSPLRKLRRINEASHFFENHLRQQIHAQDSLSCTIPTNSKGNQQRTGYPDLIISHTASDGTITHAYLDPKLFEQKSQASSLRTFYFEPRTHTNKIQHHAMHLLLGISHDGNDGDWTFTSWKLCDLSKFNVRLRAEFQSSNRDIYRPHIIIRTSDTAPAR